MKSWEVVPVAEFVPGTRFLFGCVIVTVESVTLGLDLVLLRTTTGARLRLPPCMQVDAALPEASC